jgi:hypothetical protein
MAARPTGTVLFLKSRKQNTSAMDSVSKFTLKSNYEIESHAAIWGWFVSSQ